MLPRLHGCQHARTERAHASCCRCRRLTRVPQALEGEYQQRGVAFEKIDAQTNYAVAQVRGAARTGAVGPACTCHASRRGCRPLPAVPPPARLQGCPGRRPPPRPLPQEFKVSKLPTLILFNAQGEAVDRYEGVLSAQDLDMRLRTLIAAKQPVG